MLYSPYLRLRRMKVLTISKFSPPPSLFLEGWGYFPVHGPELFVIMKGHNQIVSPQSVVLFLILAFLSR
jgi:hypothetical protein